MMQQAIRTIILIVIALAIYDVLAKPFVSKINIF
jgi:hypothetical protein